MQTRTALFRSSMVLLSALALAACSNDMDANDRQVDDDYVDQTEDGYDENARLIGSTGEASGDVSVVKAFVVESGTIVEVGSAAMSEDGESYSLDLDAQAGSTVVLEAEDDSGARIGSTLVVELGAEGETTQAAPMSSETHVEAQVFLDIQADRTADDEEADGDAVESSVAATVRLLIDGELAAEAEESGDAEAMADLAASIAVAVEAEARSWSDEGERFELDGTIDLFTQLDAELSDDEETGDTSLDIDLDALLEARAEDREHAGMDASERASVDSAISLGLISSLESRDADEDMEDRAARIGAILEATASVEVLSDFFEEHDMDEDVERSVLDAAAMLEADVFAAASAEEADEAWTRFDLMLLGELDLDSEGEDEGIFEDLLDLDQVLDLSATLEVVIEARAELEGRVSEEADSMEADAEGFASFLLDAQAEFEADISSSVEGMSEGMSEAEADLAVTVVTEAQGRFVAR